ncbi:MAG: cysteine synthase family protein [Leptolyngbya sp. SIO3F4]|nr:cysteine synthase family protein [Leptolyngbya sp. SIO3F4]
MRIRTPYKTCAESIELPRIIRLKDNFYVAAFSLMKLLPARFILSQARNEELVGPNSVIIETTSGTFGLSLALACKQNNYSLILVSDPAIDTTLKRRLEDLGAVVEIIQKPSTKGGFQQARLNRVNQLRALYPNHFWPSQYDNPYNPGAYAPFAELLAESIGHVDCLVGTVGSGGSVCGTSSYLRVLFPELYVIGVDTHGSVIFGHSDEKRMLRGLGNSLIPRNVTHTTFNEIHWINASEAFYSTRLLHQKYGLFMGGTSGASHMAADWYAQENPEKVVVAILPDEGYRYQNTIYNDDWLCSQGIKLSSLTEEPETVLHPHKIKSHWSRLAWNRRTYEQVVK